MSAVTNVPVHPRGAVINKAGDGLLLAHGTTVPTDATAGYATGCLFIHTDGGNNDSVYVNEGTNTSCTFNVVAVDPPVDLTGLTSSVDELNILTGVVATAAELNRSSDMSTRVVDCTASTLAVTEALHDGKIITLNRAAGIAVTLPVPVAGMWFRFIVGTTFTGAATIKSSAGTEIMIGQAIMGNDSDNTVVKFPALAASTYDTIDLLGTGNSTGGIAGQTIEIRGLSATLWHVTIVGDAAGTEATPFADTVA